MIQCNPTSEDILTAAKYVVPVETAVEYGKAGLSVLPASKQKKCPIVPHWKENQEHRKSEAQIRALWEQSAPEAICIVCGKVSGNLEVIDFDNHGELFPKWSESLPRELYDRLVIEQSPSGGYHVAYRCEEPVCGNIKLATGLRDGKRTTLIETRGEGGLVLCAPSKEYTLIQNGWESLPAITSEEREDLLSAAAELNEEWKECEPSGDVDKQEHCSLHLRPGDDFNERGLEETRCMLEKSGWTPVRMSANGSELWRRPGKDEGVSASLGEKHFYVFSTNAAPFEGGTCYSFFAVCAYLFYGKDFHAASAALAEYGFGTRMETLPTAAELAKGQRYFNAIEMLSNFPKPRPVLIDNVLRRGEVMNVIAAPKTGKSWLMLQLAYAVITGGEWLGFQCRQGTVLIIDNELHAETLTDRLRTVIRENGIPEDSPQLMSLYFNPQRGRQQDLVQFAASLGEFKKRKVDLVIVDALYRALPADVDENSNGQITHIYNIVDQYAQEVDAGIILVHHTSKGTQTGKSVTDLGAGAGAQSRACDTHMGIIPHDEDGIVPGVFDVKLVVRSFDSIDPFCIRRVNGISWSVDPMHSPGRKSNLLEAFQIERHKTTPQELVDGIIGQIRDKGDAIPKTELKESVKEKFADVSRNIVRKAIDSLLASRILASANGNPALKQQATKFISLADGYQTRLQDVSLAF